MKRSMKTLGLMTALMVGLSSTAMAHTITGVPGGFVSGFSHPILGWDHVVAMVAVGLWGAFLDRKAMWLLPVVFPLVMSVGGALGIAGVPLPHVEVGIAVSGIVLGLMIALAVKAPIPVAAGIVGLFAIFHGHAHGTELPMAANAIAYSIGFVLATGMLHMIGISFGLLSQWPAGKVAVRVAGAAIAMVGFFFLTQAL